MFVLELSSYQLETTSSLKPVAAAVLNVSANHLDRYAGIADYAAAKARIFEHATVQILNRDDPIVRSMRLPGRTVQTFGAGVPLRRRNGASSSASDGAWLARGGELLMQASRLALVGRHNALNALAALALASSVAKIGRPVLDALAAVSRPAAPDGARRRSRRRAVHQRFEGHDGRRDAGRARGHRPAGRADRRRRRQGPELRAAAVAASSAHAARCC